MGCVLDTRHSRNNRRAHKISTCQQELRGYRWVFRTTRGLTLPFYQSYFLRPFVKRHPCPEIALTVLNWLQRVKPQYAAHCDRCGLDHLLVDRKSCTGGDGGAPYGIEKVLKLPAANVKIMRPASQLA